MKISKTSLNGNNFSFLHGFGMMIDSNTSYYVMDYDLNNIFLLNDNYAFVTNKPFSKPTYMLTINSSLYITGDKNIWKTDKYLNVLIAYYGSGYYRDIYYNTTENLIYVAPKAYTYFQVFDLNLTLIYNVNLSFSNPRSFGDYNTELYVGTLNNLIYVFVNKVIVRSYKTCSGGNIVGSIIIDDCGFMSVSCQDIKVIELYYSNGSFTGKNLTTPARPTYIGYDSKGRYLLVSGNQISVYF